MIPLRVLKLAAALAVITTMAAAQEDYYHPELEWHTIETQHFFVHFHDGAERTARVIAKVAEEIYGPITSLYRHEPDEKVSFVVKDYDDYSNGGAYFFDNKIEIWASALDFDLRGTHNWLRNVISHEFTHVVQMQTAMKFGRQLPAFYLQWLGYESERRPDVLYGYPNVIVSYPISGISVPSWFAEGVAQYNRKEFGYDSWDTHRDMILRMYALDDKLLTWNEMSVFGKTSLGNESSYNAGFAFVRFIADRYGEDKLREISENLATLTETTIDGAIKRALGKSGEEIYGEWKEHLKIDYTERSKGVERSLEAGEIIANVGFGNFYPLFSPDGKKLAYISNKESDYFGLSSIYLYDVATKQEKLLKEGIRASISWSPDGKKIYYSKITRRNPHWSNYADVYVYDIEKDQERRLTNGLRAASPSVSPDGSTIAYVAGKDGTLNIFRVNADGTDARQLTSYANSEQVYSPKWSPDGKTIVFDFSIKDGRDIATIPAGGGGVTFLIASPADERNAVFTSDGSSVIYSSDKSGIFNLYRFDLRTRSEEQLTNVLGGAFMPAANGAGQLAFASYTSTGYKIAMMDSVHFPEVPLAYVRAAGEDNRRVLKESSGDTVRLPTPEAIMADTGFQRDRSMQSVALDSANRTGVSFYRDSWAILIGINKYQNVEQLNYAVADVESVKSLLTVKFGFPTNHIIVLSDTAATKKKILDAFGTLLETGPDDRALVFYAGHGTQIDLPAGGEMGYLVPVDGQVATKSDLYSSCISMEEIKNVSKQVPAKHILFLVDACYSGLAAITSRALSREASRYFEKLSSARAREVITAGGRGEKSVEKSEWGHSAFTRSLLEGLNNDLADLDGDGLITASELAAYLRARVTSVSDGRETPQFKSLTDDEGDFVFVAKSRGGTNVNPIVGTQHQVENLVPESYFDSDKSYDDSNPPVRDASSYQTIASSISFVPFVRVDNYNPRNKGIDVIKPGVFVYSYDVLDRYGFIASAAMNRNGERDLFFTFDYRGKIPGLFQLGLEPSLSLEVYNLTRKNFNAELSLETRPDLVFHPSVTYNLLEFDVVLRQKFISELVDLEARFTHSRYTASIGFFVLEDPLSGQVTPSSAFSNLYFIGNDISLTWKFENIALSRTREINPVGTKVQLRYDYELNEFNPTSDYEISSDGTLVPKYQHPNFHRLELNWRESHQLPGWKHTFNTQVRAGTIFGPSVDEFFNFYIGGLAGMKGYPFYSLGGNQFGYLNLAYRFPMLEHIDVHLLQIYFDKLYASVYGDVGSAWSGGGSALKDQKFKRDAGIELRLQSFSYYAFPTCIFFDATYGFDQFTHYVSSDGSTVTYGKEWNFHFGVLFGFDLD